MAKLSGKYLDPNSFKNNTSTGDGSTVNYVLTHEPASAEMLTVSVNGLITNDYSLTKATKTVTFNTAPALGQNLIFTYIKV